MAFMGVERIVATIGSYTGDMSTFEPVDARQAFRAFLRQRGLDEHALPFRDGFEAMFDFFRDVRPNRCAGEDADMLLVQWGTYDRAFLPRGDETGEAFDIDLTRQLIPEGGEDEDIFQLSLTFVFEPVPALRDLGNGNRWCHTLQELPQFRGDVLASAPFLACVQHRVRRMFLDYQCAG